MPRIYTIGQVWCTKCGESRDESYLRCPECNKLLRRKTRARR